MTASPSCTALPEVAKKRTYPAQVIEDDILFVAYAMVERIPQVGDMGYAGTAIGTIRSKMTTTRASQAGSMKHASTVALLVGVLLVQVSEVRVAEQFAGTTAPYVIFWPQAPDSRNPPTAVGLLYTPSVLAVLARESPDSVSPRIDNAIREQTPIVVIWAIPPMATADWEPWPRPFSSVIVEGGADSFGSPSGGRAVRIEPQWIEQHADDLRRLDHRTRFSDVGVMAAYPRSAFVPGRFVTIFVRVPSEPGTLRGAQRFGLLAWNGATE